MPAKHSGKPVARAKTAPQRRARVAALDHAITLTHPERIYWHDVGVTKQDLADYWADVWDFIKPHVVGRPLSLLRCPDGAGSQCFFQKHAHATFNQGRILRFRDGKDELIAIDDLDGLIALAQAGVLEVHVWGSRVDSLDLCDRLIFDLDPGPDVRWADVIKAAQEVRERFDRLGLHSFVKTTGGKGFHVVVPIAGASWDRVRPFAKAVAEAMAADAPDRFVPKLTKSLRAGKIFVDYLRNGRGATAVVAYSPRARRRAGLGADRLE